MSTASFRRTAVLDIGKTHAKVVVLDGATCAEIAAVKTRNTVLGSGPYPHYDTDALWDFALAALKDFAGAFPFDSLSITTHGASLALLDRDGSLAMPVIDYEHDYPPDIRSAYDALRPPFEQTLSPRQPGGLNAGAQLHYQKVSFPAGFDRVSTIVTYPQYWAARMTGVAATEPTSLGCHTDLWNPRAAAYSALVDTLGIRGLMAPVRSAFDALGPVRPDVARQLGLADKVMVYCGIHDSNASLLPHLIGRSPPFSVVSTGTWVVVFGVGGRLDRLDPSRDTLANVDAYGRPVPSSRFMGGREFEMLAADIGHDPAAADAALAGVLARGVMLLPNVVPGSGPFPGLAGGWIGADDASPADRMAAVHLYLALMTQACLSAIGAQGPIVVEGPFAANGIYLAALSAFASAPVTGVAGATGTSMGAALLAGIAPPARTVSKTPVAPLGAAAQAYRKRWYLALTERGAAPRDDGSGSTDAAFRGCR